MEILNTPTINPHAANYLKSKVDGVQMRALQLKRIAAIQKTNATGVAKPATIINFNPVPLVLEGGLANFKVPSIIDPAVADDQRIRLEYKGKTYKGSLVTLRDFLPYSKITDVVKGPLDDVADGVGVYDIQICKQIEIAHNFFEAYTEGAAYSSNMGGVVIFEGDRHALKSDVIQVPTYINLATKEREFYCEPKPFHEVLAKSLDTQRNYYDVKIQTAQNWWNTGGEDRKNITPIDLVWAQFGLTMGWREKPVDWQLSQNDPEETCDGCGAAKKRALAIFCHACSRPYVALDAYLAGEIPVDSVHMNRIPEDQWHLVEAEEEKRAARRASRKPKSKPQSGGNNPSTT
jgi:hypothetical protein